MFRVLQLKSFFFYKPRPWTDDEQREAIDKDFFFINSTTLVGIHQGRILFSFASSPFLKHDINQSQIKIVESILETSERERNEWSRIVFFPVH